jgi:catechol 2,3-dioxygenase-like lactoylglutathione lyase family enzyme
MLTNGFNHVAVITPDLDRFIAFYSDVFEARVKADFFEGPDEDHKLRMAIIDVGPHSEFNAFEMPANPEAMRQTPMFGRGRLDTSRSRPSRWKRSSRSGDD